MEQIRVGNSQYIRDLNLLGIFRLINKLGPITRKELADKTSFSAATVTNHIKTLLKKEFVIETEKGHSTGGRKPIFVKVNAQKGYIFSVEIEVSRVNIVMFNLDLHVEEELCFSIGENKNPDFIMNKILLKMDELLKANEIPQDKVIGIGVAVPGLINRERNILEFAPNLGWRNINISEYLNKYQVPIILENEATAAVVGERDFGYPDAENIVYVSINDGIGCGIILNGQLYRGASGNAGEYGHIIIDEQGQECHCGNRGCWETLASESFIINKYQKLTKQVNLNVEDIYQKIEAGEEQALKIIEETAGNIGLGLVNIINSLSPKILVLGGGITKIRPYIEKNIKKVLQEKSISISYDNVDFNFTKIKNSAVIYGLASYVFAESINLIKD